MKQLKIHRTIKLRKGKIINSKKKQNKAPSKKRVKSKVKPINKRKLIHNKKPISKYVKSPEISLTTLETNTQLPETSNLDIQLATQSQSPPDKKATSICAPFIEPFDLSKGHGLSDSNIKIIQSATDESCFSIEALRKIADKWNETRDDNMKIEYNDSTTGKYLWSAINNVMRSKCNNEVCWIKQDFIKDSPLSKELLKNFKPFMPAKWESKPNEWLNTIDIRDVMNQYEKKFPAYEFIGPVPMDFDTKVGFGQCVIDELCKISLKSLLDKGKDKIGVIFNLDKHTQSGSHWVAMHCEINKQNNTGSIYYWDSYGIKPNPEVVVLMNKLKTQGAEINYNIEIKINNIRHQYKNSECGVYCIYFLTSLLEGKTFDNIIKNIISDDNMNAKRKHFFSKIDSK